MSFRIEEKLFVKKENLTDFKNYLKKKKLHLFFLQEQLIVYTLKIAAMECIMTP